MSVVFLAYIVHQRAWPFLCVKDGSLIDALAAVHLETVTGPVLPEVRLP